MKDTTTVRFNHSEILLGWALRHEQYTTAYLILGDMVDDIRILEGDVV